MDELKRIEQKLDELRSALLVQKSIMSISEASEYTGYSLSFFYKLIHFNKIPFYKPNGRKVFFEREVLDSFLRQGLVETPEQIEKKIASRINGRRKNKIDVR
jgi:excisionase family DNA binding protein